MRRRAAALVVLALAGGALALDALLPPPLERFLARASVVADRSGEPLRAFTAKDGIWRFATRVRDVDPLYLRMLTAFEDKRFHGHPGVDPLALGRAVLQWAKAGRVVSGGSTLTMQTARLLEPRPRTVLSKLAEMARAVQLEAHYAKDEILGMYLTLAPFGGNLEGVRAASRFYFGKPPKSLSAGEAALLVALPQSPTRLRPDRHPDRARAARDKVLARMAAVGVLDEKAAAEAREDAVPGKRFAAPMLAPHLARRLRASGAETVATTIDRGLQRKAEAVARRHLARLETEASIAILVVENETRKVRAYVGSGDFLNARRLGHVDMVRAARSPGSTLKPFIYGLAFDHLTLHPETLVDDRPMRFGDYAPANFDNRYRGAVTVREALQLSLNVPAVAVLDRLGPGRFQRLLTGTGAAFRFDKRAERAGLALALGGVGVSLWDLTALYAGVASGGEFVPLRVRDGETAPPKRMISASAAWHLDRILRGAPPPDGRLLARHTAKWRDIGLKTGTSYGFRDAWALGWDDGHTVGVWVGRADGGFGTGLTGGKNAAPALYDVFDVLPDAGPGKSGPPEGALAADKTEDLPPPFRRFRHRGWAFMEDGPEILFPPDGAVVEFARGDALRLEARGGRRPLTWLVDGRPLASSPVRRDASWSPGGAGRSRITVLDGSGRAATAGVWLQMK